VFCDKGEISEKWDILGHFELCERQLSPGNRAEAGRSNGVVVL
jgi:hypothetical protein